MARIAISYRRSDSQDITGRIFDRLAAHYGKDTVFRDIDSIQPGIDFRTQIADALGLTDVLLVIAGPAWLGHGKNGGSRMSNEADPVRVEVETALKRNIPIIPVLVGGMRMPEVGELPASLKDFAYRHAVTVDGGRDFDHHIEGLIRALDRIVHVPPGGGGEALIQQKARQSSVPSLYWVIGGLAVMAIVLAAALLRVETKQGVQAAPPSQVAAAPAVAPHPVTAPAQPPVAPPSPPAAPPPVVAPVAPQQTAAIPSAAMPAFDCSKSPGIDEQAICHDGQLAYLDQELNVAFRNLIRTLSKEQQTVLWAQEQAWLKQRGTCGADVSCIRTAYQTRITQLQNWH